MNERIKRIRKHLDLTQAEFASRIGTTQNTLTGYESGRRNPSRSVINNICKEFNVNEEWLRNGVGEMLNPAPCDALDALAQEYSLTHGDYILIEKFINMNSSSRNLIMDYILEVASALERDDIPSHELAFYNNFQKSSSNVTLVAGRDSGVSTVDSAAVEQLGEELQEDNPNL